MRQRYSPFLLFLVLLLHGAILSGLLFQRLDVTRPVSGRYAELVIVAAIRPLPPQIPQIPQIPPPIAQAILPPTNREKAAHTRSANMPSRPLGTENPAALPATLPKEETSAIAEVPATEKAPAADPLHDTTLDIGGLVKQAGRADRATRSGKEMAAYGRARDSMGSVLERAFREARLAVPPRWYEAARIERFSAPNDTAEIYQVTTAFGTYCVFYPDKVRDPNGAGANRVRVSSCPTRF